MIDQIKFCNVFFKSKHPPRTIISDLNLSFYKNDFVIILGNNGSGKSSLLKLLDRRYTSTSGRIYINGKNIESFDNKTFSKLFFTLTQQPLTALFPSLTIYENCQIASMQNSKRQRMNKKYFENYLSDFNSDLPNSMNRLVGVLSGGEQQALALSLACLSNPQILLLDEHTSALDPLAADRLMEITNLVVKKYNITCLLTTHNLEQALKYGSRLIALNQGKLICDFDENKKKQLDANDLKKYCYA